MTSSTSSFRPTSLGTYVGLGMMALGALSRIAASGSPKADPMGSHLDEGGGSLIVFGAAIVLGSAALKKFGIGFGVAESREKAEG
jgi:hypothetical protein